MYIPTSFAEDDPAKLRRFIAANGFATLITLQDGRPFATHLPMLYETDTGGQGVVAGHVARANPQWRTGPGAAMAIFTGPHAYVSPAFYEEEEVVPTWNYVAVHVYGQVTFFEDAERLRALLHAMVENYEGQRERPWQWRDETEYSRRMLPGIVGVHLAIEHIEGKWKLGQNHTAERRRRVIAALERQGDEKSLAIAALMNSTL